MDEEYAFIWDNATIHNSLLIQKFLADNKLSLITIPKYCPFVNAWEKAILNIKSRVRKMEREGKEISLMAFKGVINMIIPQELESWVKMSFRDTLELLK